MEQSYNREDLIHGFPCLLMSGNRELKELKNVFSILHHNLISLLGLQYHLYADDTQIYLST